MICGSHLTGKTAFLKKICLEFLNSANKQDLLPVYVDCSLIQNCQALLNAADQSKQAFLREMIRETQDTRFFNLLQGMLEDNKLVFFIDQLDHVDQNKLQIIQIISTLDKSQIVLACRRCLASQLSHVASSRLWLYSL